MNESRAFVVNRPSDKTIAFSHILFNTLAIAMNWNQNETKRSWPCNGDLLRVLRERKNWTQKDLAKASGYTERLISKAESGRPISVAAIEILAKTLSMEDEPVESADLTSRPLDLAKRYIDALYTQSSEDFHSTLSAFLHEDVEFNIAGDPSVIPFAGTHRGPDAVRRCFEIFFSILQIPAEHDYRPWYTFAAQANEAFIWGQTWIHPIGRPMDEPLDIQNRLVFNGGKLILYEDRFDTAHANKILQK